MAVDFITFGIVIVGVFITVWLLLMKERPHVVINGVEREREGTLAISIINQSSISARDMQIYLSSITGDKPDDQPAIWLKRLHPSQGYSSV